MTCNTAAMLLSPYALPSSLPEVINAANESSMSWEIFRNGVSYIGSIDGFRLFNFRSLSALGRPFLSQDAIRQFVERIFFS